MPMLKFLSLILVASFALIPFALAADEGGGNRPKPLNIAKLDRSTPVDFEKEVLPILSTSCLACHNKTKAKAELVLETPASIRKGGENGPAVVPGKSAESLILKAAAHQIEALMPPA